MTAVAATSTSVRDRAAAAHNKAIVAAIQREQASHEEFLAKYGPALREAAARLLDEELDNLPLVEVLDREAGRKITRHCDSDNPALVLWITEGVVLTVDPDRPDASRDGVAVSIACPVCKKYQRPSWGVRSLADIGREIAEGSKTCIDCGGPQPSPAFKSQVAAPDDEDSPSRRETVNAQNLYVIARALESIAHDGLPR